MNHLAILALGSNALEFADQSFVLEELDSRRSGYTCGFGDFWVLLNIDFDVVDAPVELVNHAAEDRFERVTGAAGGRGVLDDDQAIAVVIQLPQRIAAFVSRAIGVEFRFLLSFRFVMHFFICRWDDS